MTSIKVSVIIPVYNAEKYLAECLDSVLGQTLCDIEIICVNDGSTDGSSEILYEYSKNDKRIKIVEQENQGAGTARNTGITAAKGEYLAFLDADDLYYPEALESVYMKAACHNADIIMFEAEFFDVDSGLCRKEEISARILAGLQIFSAVDVPRFIFQIASCNTWNKLYRRDTIMKHELRYQEIKTANDLCFVYSAMACAERIGIMTQSLVRHRVLHSGNLQSVKHKTPLDFFEALLLLKKNLQAFGVWEQLRQSYINCALFHCVYNWETSVHKHNKQLKSKRKDIAELLEMDSRPESYYYNRNDYQMMSKVLLENRRGGKIVGTIKNMLKHILPPPVKAFNREMNDLRQYMVEFQAAIETQQKQWNARMEELHKQQSGCTEQLNALALKIGAIEHRQQQLHEDLGALTNAAKSQFDCIVALQEKASEKNRAMISSANKDIQHTKTALSELKNDIQCINEMIPNKPVYWNNSFERKIVEANWGDMINSPDFAEKFVRLTSGLDPESTEIIIRILMRQNKYLNSDKQKLDLFTREEQEQIRLLRENFNSAILKLSDNLFAYKNYLLPINHFESSVFYYKHGLAEIETLEKVKGNAIVDVGGFVGDSVLILSELDPSAIYTFEAVPENFELLKKTVELNHIPNVIPENLALGAEAGSLSIHVCGSGSTSIERAGMNYTEDIVVPVITLDEYVEKNNLEIGLIKVDIEGGEPAFLEGAKKTICEQKPILLLSIYHNAHDFFELKPLIESWDLSYKFKIHKPIFENTTSETLLLAEIRD